MRHVLMLFKLRQSWLFNPLHIFFTDFVVQKFCQDLSWTEEEKKYLWPTIYNMSKQQTGGRGPLLWSKSRLISSLSSAGTSFIKASVVDVLLSWSKPELWFIHPSVPFEKALHNKIVTSCTQNSIAGCKVSLQRLSSDVKEAIWKATYSL